MKHFKYSVACLMVLALALVFIGCAKPPEAEQKAAKDAMGAAVSAGADKYAAADLDAAKKSLDTAEAQMKDKKYKEAKEGYVTAKAAFDKAAGAVAALAGTTNRERSKARTINWGTNSFLNI